MDISLQFIKGAPPALSFAEIRVQCVSLSGLSNLVLRYDVWRQSDGHFSDEFSPFHLFIRRRRAAHRRRVAVRKSCFLSHERQRQFENNEFRCGGAARARPLHAAIAACTMKFSNQQPPLGRIAARRRRRQPCLARVIPPTPNRFLYHLEISTLSGRTAYRDRLKGGG